MAYGKALKQCLDTKKDLDCAGMKEYGRTYQAPDIRDGLENGVLVFRLTPRRTCLIRLYTSTYLVKIYPNTASS